MTTHPIKSSAIREIGHDSARNILRVVFHNQRTYDYTDVTAKEYEALKTAKSAGQHLMQHVLPKKRGTKIA